MISFAVFVVYIKLEGKKMKGMLFSSRLLKMKEQIKVIVLQT